MITKTLNLDGAYQALFDEVREKSNGAINVNNLQAFFGSITEIAALDSKFLRLPLDEPLFEIDANTRKITIPENFRSNGASVQGDHLAEVIFFRIERYFDYKDLSTCNIEINWKMGAKEGKTTRFIKFDDVVTIDEAKADCIIFGWPINDVVTEKSGQLTFAIEFNQTEGEGENKKVIYRFNTLPTTINIKDGLVISDDAEVFTLDQDVIRTLVNSSFGEGTAAVGDIEWLTGEGHGLVVGRRYANSIMLEDFVDTINLPTEISAVGEPSSAPLDFYAQGWIDEGTEIQYADSNNVPAGSTGSNVVLETVAVRRPLIEITDLDNLDPEIAYYLDDEAQIPANINDLDLIERVYMVAPLIEGLKYYKRSSNNPEAFELATTEDLATWGKNSNVVDVVEIFIKVAKTVAEDAGSYTIHAQGYKMSSAEGGHKIGSGEMSSTDAVVIPSVSAPSGVNIEVSERPDASAGYSFTEEADNVVFLNNGTGTILAEAEVENFGALQFSWEKKIGSATVFSAVAEDVPFQRENESELEITEPGEYKVKVVNFLNTQSAPAVESAVITASPLAGKIVSANVLGRIGANSYSIIQNGRLAYDSTVLSRNSATLKVDINTIGFESGNDAHKENGFEFQWQRQMRAGDFDTYWEDIPGATGVEFTITGGDGIFRPVIKNNYNGSIYTFEAGDVSVDDEGR